MDTSTSDHARIIAQIRSLQALAESTSINEAAAAAFAARRLIEKHRISQEMLNEAKSQAEDPDTGIDDDPIIQGFMAPTWWGFFLLAVIAESHGLVAVSEEERRKAPDGTKKAFRKQFVIGTRSDREIVKTLFVELFSRLRVLLRAELDKKSRTNSWQQDWGIGAAVAIQEQLKAAKRSMAKEAKRESAAGPKGAGSAKTATALALASMDAKNKDMLALVEKNVMDIRGDGRGEIVAKNAKAFENGYARGQTVSTNIHRELGSGK